MKCVSPDHYVKHIFESHLSWYKLRLPLSYKRLMPELNWNDLRYWIYDLLDSMFEKMKLVCYVLGTQTIERVETFGTTKSREWSDLHEVLAIQGSYWQAYNADLYSQEEMFAQLQVISFHIFLVLLIFSKRSFSILLIFSNTITILICKTNWVVMNYLWRLS